MRGLGLLLLLNCAAARSRTTTKAATPDDQDGIVGGNTKVLLNVSDTGYAVGGVKSGSTQPNISVQNSSSVTLTITNVGTTPHGFQIACIPTELPAGCPQQSCFADDTSIDAIEPGESVTITFDTPAVEGAYSFTSDPTGDEALIGQFVLM